MAKLPEMTGFELVRKLRKMGFSLEREHGSHAILRKGDKVVIVPMHHRDLGKGILESIIKHELGMSVQEFISN